MFLKMCWFRSPSLSLVMLWSKTTAEILLHINQMTFLFGWHCITNVLANLETPKKGSIWGGPGVLLPRRFFVSVTLFLAFWWLIEKEKNSETVFYKVLLILRNQLQNNSPLWRQDTTGLIFAAHTRHILFPSSSAVTVLSCNIVVQVETDL